MAAGDMETPPRRRTTHVRLSPLPPPPLSTMKFIMVILFLSLSNTNHNIFLTNAANAPAKSLSFTPPDNYLLDCGGSSSTTAPGNRVFLGDQQTDDKYLTYQGRDIRVSSSPQKLNVPSPIYLSAKIFETEAVYAFSVARPGWHWARLHFAAVPNSNTNLNTTSFQVKTNSNLVLIDDFNMDENSTWTMMEYLINVTTPKFSLTFEPAQGSVAFINAIEFVSAPDILINDVAMAVFPKGDYSGLEAVAYETMYRLDVGGPLITAENDTLGRRWEPDTKYLQSNMTGNHVSVETKVITYPDGESPLIAPPVVYATATQLADANVQVPNFNITWKMSIDDSFQYLVRLHFADIVSKSENDLYFNVYINGKTVISGLDLTTVAGGLSAAYYADFVVNSTMVSGLNPITVQIGPMNQNAGTRNALLNGLEVLKMNNTAGSLGGDFGAHKKPMSGHRKTVAAVGFAMMFGAFVGLGSMAAKWRKRPTDWHQTNSISSWLLPVHAGDTSFSKSSMGSKRSQFFSSTLGLGRYFGLLELQEATKNWDPNAIIGVGGFGNVYLGVIEHDGTSTKVAVKRGNPQSEQGITEFQTEIQMLSKVRHRHLVSLIGYCDENSEMILVYEYMANGPFRDHLYGKDLPPLAWEKRLEICIGSARGLHYLHTGSAQGIIHRDVKTTNILIDENFIAKMADFGLSKDGPTTDQAHVSTMVKGSFGYLDPEYFRKQQLTEKSDVYSFGVVLLEALCARVAIDPTLPREQVNLAEWAMQWKRKGMIEKIIDPTLVGDINPDSMKKFAEAAEKCLAEYGVDRPTMGDVLWNLEYALQLQVAASKSHEENKTETTAPELPVPAAKAEVKAEAVGEVKPVAGAGGGEINVEAEGIDEHSKSAVFANFGALDGR